MPVGLTGKMPVLHRGALAFRRNETKATSGFFISIAFGKYPISRSRVLCGVDRGLPSDK